MWSTVDFGHANLCKFWIALQEQNWFFLVVCLMSLDVIILLLDQSVLVKDLDLSVFFFSDHSVLVMDFKFGVLYFVIGGDNHLQS
jgi:hypothetical protein